MNSVDCLQIAVLGTGRVGGTLGRRWAQQGHQVLFGSREPASERVLKLLSESPNARALPSRDAVTESDLVVYAGPWAFARAILAELGPMPDKILVDCTNPLTADFTGLDVGHTTSAAERIAEWVPGARVVKAFN